MIVRHDKQYNISVHTYGIGRNEYDLLSAAQLSRWLYTWAYTPNATIIAEGNYTRSYSLVYHGLRQTISIRQSDANLMRDGL